MQATSNAARRDASTTAMVQLFPDGPLLRSVRGRGHPDGFGFLAYQTSDNGAVRIITGRCTNVERLLLVLSLVYFAYPVSAFMAHPDW